MKKLASFALSFALLLSLAACGSKIPSGELSITIPEGFVEVDPGDSLTKQYTCKDNDGASINLVAAERDDSAGEITKESFASTMKKGLEDAFGEDVKFEVKSFEGGKFLGCPGYSVCYTFEVMGIKFTQYQIAASTAGYLWKKAFWHG